MKNKVWKIGAIAVLFFAFFFVAAPTAEACLLCGHGGCGGCGLFGYGSRTSFWCDPCYDPCPSTCWEPCCSPCRPIFPLRFHHGWRSWGCGVGCGWGCGSSTYGGGYYGGGSCCGGGAFIDSGVAVPDSQGPTVAPSTTYGPDPAGAPEGPATYGPTIPSTTMPPATTPPATTTPMSFSTNETGSAVLSLVVPEDAQVFINGAPTQTQGIVRQYVSPDLQAGYAYDYVILVQVVRDGRMIEQTREVTLQHGQDQRLAFDSFPAIDVQIAVR